MQRLRAETGGIYIEALVAIAILAIALIPIIGSFAITPAAHRQAGQQTTALNLARGRLEPLHALSGDAWDDLDDDQRTEEIDGQEYQVDLYVDDVDLYVDDEPRREGLRDVRVTVTWTDANGQTGQVTLATSVARRP